MRDNRIEKIRVEIEKAYKETQERVKLVKDVYWEGKVDAYRNVLCVFDTMQEEPKKCMYSKDDYTDEDRKVLCDGCKEECKYNKSDDFTKALAECIHHAQVSVADPMVLAELWKDELIKLAKSEEPVSENLEKAAEEYSFNIPSEIFYDLSPVLQNIWKHEVEAAFKAGAQWQKEQINEVLLSEVLPCFMHGGEADEVVAKLEEVVNKKK